MNTNLLKTFFVALFLITATGASAQDFYVDGIYYNITSTTAKTVRVTYKGDYYKYGNEYTGSVVIPSMVTYGDVAYRVTSIGNNAFHNCSGLTGVTIPYGVTSIGSNAFINCTGLTSVTIPYGVTSIGGYAFDNCSGLTSVTIPNSVTSIGNYAFADCYALTSVTIPNRVTSIESGVFADCSGLTSVTIPNSVTSIGKGAFSGCSGLTGVTIPNSVTSIGNSAFADCIGLTSVTIPNSVTNIGNSAFFDCSGLTGITIPNSVTSIGDKVFEGCRGLTGVTIPYGVTSIGSNAFSGCSGLTGVTIPNSVTTIGESAFAWCRGLTSVTIPNSVTNIGNSAFFYCYGLTSITIPNSVTTIGESAFAACTSLKTVYNFSSLELTKGSTNNGYVAYYADKVINAPNGSVEGDYVFSVVDGANTLCVYIGNGGEITLPADYKGENYVIGADVFKNNTALTSITIPSSVTSIGDYAFYDCTSLKTVYNFSSLELTKGSTGNGYVAYYADKVINAPNGSVEGDYVFRIVDGANTLCGYIGNGGEITLPADYKGENYVIGADVFKNNTALIGVTIPNSVTNIGNSAFEGCTGLANIIIPNSVTTIGNSAFYGCSGLSRVTIGKNVKTIKDNAFSVCRNLSDVINTSSLNIVKGSADNGYVGYYADLLINANDDLLEGDFVFGVIDGNNTLCGYIGNGGEITLPANYNGENYLIGKRAFYHRSDLVSITIPNSVTSIGYRVFYGCSNLKRIINFSSCYLNPYSYDCIVINAPNGSIEGDFVFGVIDGKNALCEYIGNDTEIVLPANYKGGDYIISSKFQGVTKITLPDFVKEIVHRQFQKCVDLNSIVMPDNITSIGAYAFQYCDLLSIHIPATVKEIGDYAFTWNLNLSSITVDKNNPVYYVPDGYKNIIMERATNKIVFACKGAVIPETATAIGNGAFNGVGGIESITIPAGITSIGDWAFDGCRDLKVIYALSETPVELPYNVFSNDAMSAITLYVPIGAKEAYATAWGFDNIVETDFTGVDGVTADEQTGGNELYYDLSGRAVKNPANGIYIYKGKKVLVQ